LLKLWWEMKEIKIFHWVSEGKNAFPENLRWIFLNFCARICMEIRVSQGKRDTKASDRRTKKRIFTYKICFTSNLKHIVGLEGGKEWINPDFFFKTIKAWAWWGFLPTCSIKYKHVVWKKNKKFSGCKDTPLNPFP
jgi:hypothetical protein